MKKAPKTKSAPASKSSIARVSAASPGTIAKKSFGKTADGQSVAIYTLRNANGVEAKITNYGGIVVSLKVPDRKGKLADVALGYDTLGEYIQSSPYFGAIVGRVGNRIAKGRFELEGKRYKLAVNNGPNSLHGGLKGFDKVVWMATPEATKAGPSLRLQYISADGEEGYPGTLAVTAVYTLTEKNELKLAMTAKTDKTTVVNLTHHAYFNLAGAGNGDVLAHEAMLNASQFTPTDKTSIPTGEVRPVAGSPFDFTQPSVIGARIGDSHQQIKFGGGYDHNFVIDKPSGKLGVMGRVLEPGSGRVLTVLSTAPGVQFYTGNFLDDTFIGKGGKKYGYRGGFCLEPQGFPDAPNKPGFPSVVLKPGETYRHTIVFRFSTKEEVASRR